MSLNSLNDNNVNASQIQGVAISINTPNNTNILQYLSSSNKWVYSSVSSIVNTLLSSNNTWSGSNTFSNIPTFTPSSNTYSTAFNWGPYSSSLTTITVILGVANTITLSIPSLSFVSTQNALIQSSVNMGSTYRPANAIAIPIWCSISGTGTLIIMNILNTGQINFETSTLGNINGTSFATNQITYSYIAGL